MCYCTHLRNFSSFFIVLKNSVVAVNTSGAPVGSQAMARRNGKKKKGIVEQAAVEPTPAMTAAAGALAGVVARFVVGPLDVLKIRFQVQLEPIGRGGLPSKYTSMRQALVTIVKEEGVKVGPGIRR
jgi:hypothetical protein